VDDAPAGPGPWIKIGIFMSVFNVHVNRIPAAGTITGIEYSPGRFQRANLEAASMQNERNAIALETESGQQICFVQIAGLIARRIICSVRVGQKMARGQRFGIICFGSRVDVFLPADSQVTVAVGHRVKGGSSILGKMA
jgi:phosphatidylserine decarboxylase